MFRIDLHTHSAKSPDGSIMLADYRRAFYYDKLDVIAITDHDEISAAIQIQKVLGKDKIIVGQEINTKQGEIIGLYLTDRVKPNQSLNKTISDIKKQNGLVYVPHPFETLRKGIQLHDLDKIIDSVDIIEVCNGRAFLQNNSKQVKDWAVKNNVAIVASSDAHRGKSLGKTFTIIRSKPNARNLVKQLKDPEITYSRPNVFDILAPKTSRIKKLLGRY